MIIVDSIQTTYTDELAAAPGSVSQVRESAARMVRWAKEQRCCVVLVGHVTKEGSLAGPRVLEHMVDAVLYFENEGGSRYRVIRAVKNRFGAVNELGMFAMTGKGLKEVTNPSAIFLSGHDGPVPGSVITIIQECTRPILLEVQALVDQSYAGIPRRVALGLEQNRLAMMLDVLHRHGILNSEFFLFSYPITFRERRSKYATISFVDIHQLRVFASVYKHRSFSRASEHLHLTQPTVSDHVKELEHELGCRLFDRLGRTIAPTKEADVLYVHAVEVFDKMDVLSEALGTAKNDVSGLLVIGASTIPGTYVMPRVLAAFREKFPAVTFQIVVDDSRGIIDRVAQHEILIGIVGLSGC